MNIKFRIFDKEVGKWLCEDSQYLIMEVLTAYENPTKD